MDLSTFNTFSKSNGYGRGAWDERRYDILLDNICDYILSNLDIKKDEVERDIILLIERFILEINGLRNYISGRSSGVSYIKQILSDLECRFVGTKFDGVHLVNSGVVTKKGCFFMTYPGRD